MCKKLPKHNIQNLQGFCGISAWAPTKNLLMSCKSRREANLITTFDGRSLLSLYITENSLAWVQHMHMFVCKNSKMKLFHGGNWQRIIHHKNPCNMLICKLHWCLFPKMRIYLPFPFEVFETKHYTLLAFLMSNVDSSTWVEVCSLCCHDFPKNVCYMPYHLQKLLHSIFFLIS
jgi:hypothetical protein